MIDLTALEALSTVEREGSVHAAATVLGFTPSAVSQQVKRLERQVGLELLERVGRGVILTAAGQRLVASAAHLAGELERVQAELHEATARVSGRVRVSAFSTSVRGLVAPALVELRAAHPSLDVLLEEQEPWETVGLVAAGRVDLGLAHSWGDLPLEVPDHLVATEVTRDVADVIVHRDHPLAARRRVSPTDLLDVGWIATAEGTICRAWLSRMYVGTGTTPRIVHVSAEFASHLALAAAGLGVALVPRLGRGVLPREVVAVRVVDPVPERVVTALHRRSMDRLPSVHAVLDALCAQAARSATDALPPAVP